MGIQDTSFPGAGLQEWAGRLLCGLLLLCGAQWTLHQHEGCVEQTRPQDLKVCLPLLTLDSREDRWPS